MKSDGRYYVSADIRDYFCDFEVKDSTKSMKNNILRFQIGVEFGSIRCALFTGFYPDRDVRYQHTVGQSRFLDFSEDEWILNCMIDNVPQKYLKFIVGLYKLHTNQISTSELEQLVLDNIEDLL